MKKYIENTYEISNIKFKNLLIKNKKINKVSWNF